MLNWPPVISNMQGEAPLTRKRKMPIVLFNSATGHPKWKANRLTPLETLFPSRRTVPLRAENMQACKDPLGLL
jgi:hypothetical protein